MKKKEEEGVVGKEGEEREEAKGVGGVSCFAFCAKTSVTPLALCVELIHLPTFPNRLQGG